MSSQEINGYTNEQTSLSDSDWFDIDAYLGVDDYESKKVSFGTIKNQILSQTSNVFNSDGTLTGDRYVFGDNKDFRFNNIDRFEVSSNLFNIGASGNAIGSTSLGFFNITVENNNLSSADKFVKYNSLYSTGWNSTTDKKALVPLDFVTANGTTADRPTNNITGQQYYNTENSQLEIYDGNNWVNAGSINDFFDVETDVNGNITKIISKYDLQVPPQSIEVGEAIKISDLAQIIGYSTKYNNDQYLVPSYNFSDNGSQKPVAKKFGLPTSFDIQPLDDITLQAGQNASFNILSQQDVIGELYTLKIYSDNDIRLRVYRLPENGGEKTLLVNEVIQQIDLSLDGSPLVLTPLVDFEINKLYELNFTSDSDITLKGTEFVSGTYGGISVLNTTTFVPYVKRDKGFEYTNEYLAYESDIPSDPNIQNKGNAIAEFSHYSFKSGVDNDNFFNDGNIKLSWDSNGNDLEVYMLTEPAGTGDLVAIATKGVTSAVSTYITQTNFKYDVYPAGVNATEGLVVWITAEEDPSYPNYKVFVHNAGSSYNSNIEIKKIIPKD